MDAESDTRGYGGVINSSLRDSSSILSLIFLYNYGFT